MIEAILTFFVFVGTLSFIVTPLVKRAGYYRRVNEDTTLRNLEQEKFNIYAQIKEADFEYEMGKLSYRDYQLQRQELLEKAEQVLDEVDNYENATAMQGGEKASVAANEPAKANSVCPSCHAELPVDANFCRDCGEDLKSAANSCTTCGIIYSDESNFCANCGEGLALA